MAKAKRKKEPFSWKKFWVRFVITLSTVAVLGVVVPVGISYAAHDRVARKGVYDKHGNLINGGWTWANISARFQDGWNTLKGNFTQFGNHVNSNGWGTNADILDKWAKQKGKLTKTQIHGGGNVDGTKIENMGLYGYAKSIGIDPKAYKSNAALLSAVRKYVHQKSKATDKAGEEGKRMWGSVGREQANQKKVWDHYTSGLLKVKGELDKSSAAKVNAYLKKHGGEKGSDKWYKALDAALNKYAKGKAKRSLEATEKKKKKEEADVGEGEKKTSAADVEKMLQTGDLPEPTTLWGKIGKALMNVFWSSAVSDWLEKNGPGSSIFAGATDPSTLAAQVQDNPQSLIYPTNEHYTTMTQVSEWLQPAMIAAGGALITLTLVITTMKMGWGQAIDPVRSRMAWYQNIIDTIISVALVAAFPLFVNEILQVDGALIMGFADFMNQISPSGSKETVFQTALKLGYDRTTLNAVSTGMLLGGSDFAGVVFEIIYLIAFVGLAVYIKYFYFIRAITFTVLVAIGPIFMALWSFNPAKGRTFAWLRDFLGTVFINVIHALTLTFMALFMDWNNGRIVGQSASYIAGVLNWQKANPGKQFLNTITGGLANQGPSSGQLQGGASVFEVLVVGFIIMILFKPLSKSLAELFGINTNMLDNIYHSTSNTLKAGALVGGGALVAGSVAPAAIAGRTLKEGVGALKDGIKANRGKKALGWRDKLKNIGKSTYASANRRKPFRSSLAKMNGIVGPGAGRLIGFAAGAGAGDPTAMLALSKAGGAMGERAARLANKPLSALGLGQIYRAGRYLSKKKPEDSKYVDGKVKAANAKTQDSLTKGNQAVRDANDG
ncbi:type IV secretion system protein, partial [Lactobacillus crispatus]